MVYFCWHFEEFCFQFYVFFINFRKYFANFNILHTFNMFSQRTWFLSMNIVFEVPTKFDSFYCRKTMLKFLSHFSNFFSNKKHEQFHRFCHYSVFQSIFTSRQRTFVDSFTKVVSLVAQFHSNTNNSLSMRNFRGASSNNPYFPDVTYFKITTLEEGLWMENRKLAKFEEILEHSFCLV